MAKKYSWEQRIFDSRRVGFLYDPASSDFAYRDEMDTADPEGRTSYLNWQNKFAEDKGLTPLSPEKFNEYVTETRNLDWDDPTRYAYAHFRAQGEIQNPVAQAARNLAARHGIHRIEMSGVLPEAMTSYLSPGINEIPFKANTSQAQGMFNRFSQTLRKAFPDNFAMPEVLGVYGTRQTITPTQHRYSPSGTVAQTASAIRGGHNQDTHWQTGKPIADRFDNSVVRGDGLVHGADVYPAFSTAPPDKNLTPGVVMSTRDPNNPNDAAKQIKETQRDLPKYQYSDYYNAAGFNITQQAPFLLGVTGRIIDDETSSGRSNQTAYARSARERGIIGPVALMWDDVNPEGMNMEVATGMQVGNKVYRRIATRQDKDYSLPEFGTKFTSDEHGYVTIGEGLQPLQFRPGSEVTYLGSQTVAVKQWDPKSESWGPKPYIQLMFDQRIDALDASLSEKTGAFKHMNAYYDEDYLKELLGEELINGIPRYKYAQNYMKYSKNAPAYYMMANPEEAARIFGMPDDEWAEYQNSSREEKAKFDWTTVEDREFDIGNFVWGRDKKYARRAFEYWRDTAAPRDTRLVRSRGDLSDEDLPIWEPLIDKSLPGGGIEKLDNGLNRITTVPLPVIHHEKYFRSMRQDYRGRSRLVNQGILENVERYDPETAALWRERGAKYNAAALDIFTAAVASGSPKHSMKGAYTPTQDDLGRVLSKAYASVPFDASNNQDRYELAHSFMRELVADKKLGNRNLAFEVNGEIRYTAKPSSLARRLAGGVFEGEEFSDIARGLLEMAEGVTGNSPEANAIYNGGAERFFGEQEKVATSENMRKLRAGTHSGGMSHYAIAYSETSLPHGVAAVADEEFERAYRTKDMSDEDWEGILNDVRQGVFSGAAYIDRNPNSSEEMYQGLWRVIPKSALSDKNSIYYTEGAIKNNPGVLLNASGTGWSGSDNDGDKLFIGMTGMMKRMANDLFGIVLPKGKDFFSIEQSKAIVKKMAEYDRDKSMIRELESAGDASVSRLHELDDNRMFVWDEGAYHRGSAIDQQLGKFIGSFYNATTDLQSFASTDDPARMFEARDLHRLMYGVTQAKKTLPEGLQRIANVLQSATASGSVNYESAGNPENWSSGMRGIAGQYSRLLTEVGNAGLSEKLLGVFVPRHLTSSFKQASTRKGRKDNWAATWLYDQVDAQNKANPDNPITATGMALSTPGGMKVAVSMYRGLMNKFKRDPNAKGGNPAQNPDLLDRNISAEDFDKVKKMHRISRLNQRMISKGDGRTTSVEEYEMQQEAKAIQEEYGAPSRHSSAPDLDNLVENEVLPAEEPTQSTSASPPSPYRQAVELAERNGVDLGDVKGTGQGGRVLKSDVQSYIDNMSVTQLMNNPVTMATESMVAQSGGATPPGTPPGGSGNGGSGNNKKPPAAAPAEDPRDNEWRRGGKSSGIQTSYQGRMRGIMDDKTLSPLEKVKAIGEVYRTAGTRKRITVEDLEWGTTSVMDKSETLYGQEYSAVLEKFFEDSPEAQAEIGQLAQNIAEGNYGDITKANMGKYKYALKLGSAALGLRNIQHNYSQTTRALDDLRGPLIDQYKSQGMTEKAAINKAKQVIDNSVGRDSQDAMRTLAKAQDTGIGALGANYATLAQSKAHVQAAGLANGAINASDVLKDFAESVNLSREMLDKFVKTGQKMTDDEKKAFVGNYNRVAASTKRQLTQALGGSGHEVEAELMMRGSSAWDIFEGGLQKMEELNANTKLGGNVMGFLRQLASPFSGTRAMMNYAWQWAGAPTFNEYMPAAAQMQMSYNAFAAQGSELPTYSNSPAMRYQALMSQRQMNRAKAGGAAFQTYGGLVGAFESEQFHTAKSVFGPVIGAGAIAGIGTYAFGSAIGAGSILGVSGPALAAAAGPVAAGATLIGLPIAAYAWGRGMAADNSLSGKFDAYEAYENPSLWNDFKRGLRRVGHHSNMKNTFAENEANFQRQGTAAVPYLTRPFSSMGYADRSDAVKELSERLMETDEFKFLEIDQVLNSLSSMESYGEIDGQGIEQIMDSPELRNRIKAVATRGGAEQYQGIANSFGLGRSGALELSQYTQGMSSTQSGAFLNSVSQLSPLAGYGLSTAQIIQLAEQNGEMSPYENARFNMMMSNPQAMAQAINGGQQYGPVNLSGRYDLQRNEANTGLTLGTTNGFELARTIKASGVGGQLSHLPGGVFGQGDYADAMMAGGTWAAEDLYVQRQRDFRNRQYNMQVERFNAQYGDGGWAEQELGLSASRLGLSRAQTLGGTYNGQAYTGSFGFQAKSIAQNYQYQLSQQGIQAEQMGLSRGRQDYTRGLQWDAMQTNRARQLTQRGWQDDDLAIAESKSSNNNMYQWTMMQLSRNQSLTQREWTMEDFNINQARSSRDFGWSMEDIDKQIRFATGRQRQQLLKQKERLTIRYNESTGDADRQMDRREELYDLEDQRYELQKNRMEENQELEEENFDKQRERLEQQRQWQDEDFEKQEDRYRKETDYIDEVRRLQDDQFELSKQRLEDTHKLQLGQLSEQKKASEESFKLQEESLAIQADRLEKQKKWQEEMLELQEEQNYEADTYEDTMRRVMRLQALINANTLEFWKSMYRAISESVTENIRTQEDAEAWVEKFGWLYQGER